MEIVGFVPMDAGYMLCADCADTDAEGTAVFDTSETDAPSHCDECGALIAESLTEDGIAYVADALVDYITAALFINADGTAKHGGSASTLDAWREEYSDTVRYLTRDERPYYGVSLVDAYDAVRAHERAMIGVVLVTCEGFARKSGDDVHGRVWTESQYDGDGTPDDCCFCGATVSDGWLCMDGGEVCCSSHVVTPDDMRAVARAWSIRSVARHSNLYAVTLGKLANDGIVDGIAEDAARCMLGLVERGRWFGRWAPVAVTDKPRERRELRALVEYIVAMRSRVYPDALLVIRNIANESSAPGHARIARIQLALDAIGLPTPNGTSIGAPWSTP